MRTPFIGPTFPDPSFLETARSHKMDMDQRQVDATTILADEPPSRREWITE